MIDVNTVPQSVPDFVDLHLRRGQNTVPHQYAGTAGRMQTYPPSTTGCTYSVSVTRILVFIEAV